MLPILNVF